MVLTEETVNVLEGAVGGFGVKEVDNGHEGSVENRPNDIKLPLQGLNPDRGDFDDC